MIKLDVSKLVKMVKPVKIMKIGSGCTVKSPTERERRMADASRRNGENPAGGSCHFSFCKSN